MTKRTQKRLHGKFVSQAELARRKAAHDRLREDIACDYADAAPSLPEPFGLWAALNEPLSCPDRIPNAHTDLNVPFLRDHPPHFPTLRRSQHGQD